MLYNIKTLFKGASDMRSEALKRAQKKYQEEKTVRVNVNLYPAEQDLIDKLESVPSKQRYIKDLIREDIKREKDTQ